MRENEYWKSVLKSKSFCNELGISENTLPNTLKKRIRTEPKFRLAVTMAVLSRFINCDAGLITASQGGLDAREQLFF